MGFFHGRVLHCFFARKCAHFFFNLGTWDTPTAEQPELALGGQSASPQRRRQAVLIACWVVGRRGGAPILPLIRREK